jgi:CP family cyanate transporter-like MFS transporter
VLVLAGLLLVAVNLRVGLAAYPPLLGTVRAALGFSAGVAGAVQAGVVVMMGIGSFAAPRFAHRLGWERALGVGAALVALGCLVRIGPSAPWLVAGSVAVGLGIGACGVLLAGVVKHHLPDRVASFTGAYAVSMMIGGAAASVLAVPLTVGLGGWSFSLAAWSVPAALAAGLWWPLARRFRAEPGGVPARLPLRSRFAWRATLYMGMSSLQYYGWLTWLAPYYEHLGWSNQRAALLEALWMLVQIPVALGVSVLVERRRRWVFWVTVSLLCGIAGVLGVLLLPLPPVVGPWLWVVLAGTSAGAGYSLGIAVIAWRSPRGSVAGAVTGMALGFGYVLAGFAPTLMGVLLDLTGRYTAPMSVLILAGVVQLVATGLIGDPPRHPLTGGAP